MYAVGDVVHMQLLGEITGPNGAEHLLRYLAVQPAHAVCLLACIQSEDGHRELLVVIVRVRTTHTDQIVPLDT